MLKEVNVSLKRFAAHFETNRLAVILVTHKNILEAMTVLYL